MAINILNTDSPREIAKKIFYNITVGSHVKIHGWAMSHISEQVTPLGDLVLEEIRYFDELENIVYYGKKRQRKHKYEPKSIGGPIAQMIFKWDKVFNDKVPTVTIWRIQ